jgi:outer membrane protein OmpA-like peptidoglycan-associated protein
MAPPPPPEEQNITPPVVPVPEEKTDAQKGDEKTAEGQKTDAEQLDVDKGDVTKRDIDKGDVTKRDVDKGDVDKGQQETAEQPKTEMEKDVDKGAPMTAEKEPQPAPAKPQQPGQTGPLTAPKAAAAAPAAAAMAESGKGCKRLDIYFNPQSMNLTDNEKKQIDALAECLRKHPGTVVKFEGRSDGVELSNGDMLAKDRAQLIADELEARGIKECRFVVVNAEPSCTQNDLACRRQNRSVSIISDF